MAKPTVPQAAKPAKKTVSVAYVGINDDDRSKTKWNGIEFRANVPVELDPDNPAHYVVQLMPKTFPGANGEVLTKHVEQRMFMGEMAKSNPGFEVDGKRARRKVSSRVVPPAGAEWTEAHEGQVSYSDEIDESVAA